MGSAMHDPDLVKCRREKKKLKTKSNHQKTNNSVNMPSVKNNTELIDWMIKQKITKKLIKNNKKIITKIIERKKNTKF